MARQRSRRYVGGQAVMEGVMMRGERTWAVAVRDPDGGLEVEVHDAPRWAERWSQVLFVRGVVTLAESLSLGFKALSWSANRQVPEDEKLGKGAMGTTIVFAVGFFLLLFVVLPAFGARGLLSRWVGTGVWVVAIEGLLRLAIFLGYLALIGRLPDIRRVFEYHGAEHKAIAAYERGVEVTPESAQQFTTEHVRCGTNFLLTVMVIAIVVYSVFTIVAIEYFGGRPGLWVTIVSRILLIPVVAGVSYEVIRFAAGHLRWWWVRALMKPGLALQRLTTREPTLEQLEVAVSALRAVLTAEQLAEVEARASRAIRAATPALGTA